MPEILRQFPYSCLGVITDSNTLRVCYPLLKSVLPDHSVFSFPAGEINKHLGTCQDIWTWMTEEGFDRKALILNLGGGVTGDMGGFCAATFKRGIRFINLPTSLLSMVDASVGGKLGIDFKGFKNHIGVFTDPETVIVASEFLKTLPQSELRSGYAEVIKHGLIQDGAYFSQLRFSNWESQDWDTLIRRSAGIKKQVVDQDPKESGLRKILNFGHTIGHAFESFCLDSAKHLLHGEAIAIGMICEAWLSNRKSGLSADQLETITDFLLSVYGHFEVDALDIERIVSLCLQDKKNVGSTINFSLLRAIGDCTYDISCSVDEISEAIQFYQSIPQKVSKS